MFVELMGAYFIAQVIALALAELFDKSFFMTVEDRASDENYFCLMFIFNWTVLFPLTLHNYLLLKNIRKHRRSTRLI